MPEPRYASGEKPRVGDVITIPPRYDADYRVQDTLPFPSVRVYRDLIEFSDDYGYRSLRSAGQCRLVTRGPDSRRLKQKLRKACNTLHERICNNVNPAKNWPALCWTLRPVFRLANRVLSDG